MRKTVNKIQLVLTILNTAFDFSMLKKIAHKNIVYSKKHDQIVISVTEILYQTNFCIRHNDYNYKKSH